MTIISITGALYSGSEEVVNMIAEKAGLKVVNDREIIKATEEARGLKLKNLIKTVESKNIAFNDFTSEKEKCIAGLKMTIAEYVSKGDCIFYGILGHLIPGQVSHVLKGLVVTDKSTRIANGVSQESLTEEEVEKKIQSSDRAAIFWTNELHGKKAWDNSLYDIVVPSDKHNVSEIAEMILEASSKIKSESDDIKAACDDFILASLIESEIYRYASYCTVSVNRGETEITIEKNVTMLSRLKRKLTDIVSAIDGVTKVDIKLGVNYYNTSVTRKFEFETPTRILLVDDEKEFVHTLSERLKLREFETDVVYSGQDAIDYTADGNTEVMVLDLKMPGVDGYEVLKKVKSEKPDTEVIILTGHGSEADQEKCLEMGAFAYLQKPADIEKLTAVMKEAYEKINAKKFNAIGT